MIKSKKKSQIESDAKQSAIFCDFSSFKETLQNNPSIIDKPIDGMNNTILHHACYCEKIEYVELLLKSGASPNTPNDYNITPFHLSVSRSKIFNLFLKKKKLDVNYSCQIGNTVLHFAAMRFFKINNSQLDILSKKGIDINAQNNDLETPLHLCCKNGNVYMVESLMKCPNLNVTLRNKDNHTPIFLAAKNRHTKILSLFFKYDFVTKTDRSDLKTALTYVDKNSDIYTLISTYLKKPQALKTISYDYDNFQCDTKKKDKLSRSRSHSPKIFRHSKRFYSQDWASEYVSTNNVNVYQRFSQATHRILVMDQLNHDNDYHDQTMLEREICENKYRKELEEDLPKELDSIIDQKFSLEIIQKILNSRSFKWYTDQRKNKIELFKWMVDFLNNDERQMFLRYLKENYSSEISIQPRHKKKDKLLTLRDKMIETFKWEIDSDDIIFEQAIGIGSFGSVYRGTLTTTGDKVALKQLVNMSDDNVLAFVKEISILSRLNHPNIIKFKGASLDKNMILVMEYAELGDLKSYLQKNEVSWRTKLQFAKDISCGMMFLHNRTSPIVHRDLKCQNILVTKKGQLKVSDFGLSKLTSKIMTGGSAIGSLNWLAPEILRGDNFISVYVDIYAFGMVMYEILRDGEAPFAQLSPIQIIKAVEEGKRPPIPENCDNDYKVLMEKCWRDDPLKRPSFSEIDAELDRMINAYDNEVLREKKSPLKKRSAGTKSPKRRTKESPLSSPSKSPKISRKSKNI